MHDKPENHHGKNVMPIPDESKDLTKTHPEGSKRTHDKPQNHHGKHVMPILDESKDPTKTHSEGSIRRL
nr:hypothetical protein [Tanacetum cinerariifolium]